MHTQIQEFNNILSHLSILLRRVTEKKNEGNTLAFQSGLLIFFNKAGVNFALISSRGKPSVPPDGAPTSTARIALLGALTGP